MKKILTTLLLCLCASLMHAQVIGGNVYGGGEKGKVEGNSEVIIKSGQLGTYDADGVTSGGNVYGGGNEGDLLGHTTVKLQGGDIRGGVFGGAQQADVKKYTYVNVDGENQLHDLTVNRVFGGNDVSGEIGADLDGTEGAVDGLPFTPDVNTPDVTVDNTWQSFILTTKEKSEDLNIFIGQMFGGGNGDYDYTTGNASTNPYYGKTAPTVDRTYLQINGGTYGYVFAGGNNATINEETVISINNTSTITTATDHLDLTAMSRIDDIHLDNHVDWRLLSMGINISTFHTGHHFNRVFGGNNKADMKIMPTWNLTAGDIHDLYSGGNEGRMTSPQGILLEIKKESNISAINVFGGCRKADVRPLNGIYDVSNNDIQLADPAYKFPAGFAARTLVRGGTITNVYGGNDISGKVYGGNAVGIYTSILGDVYGGGNGSYAYTDQENLKNDLIWGDFYYDPSTASSSVEALNAIRPNAEQVSLRLWGESATNRTIIGGSVYVGGNSATLKTSLSSPKVELKIGSHVIADNVFLGNNGENMIDEEVLARYAGTVTKADMTTGNDFSTLDLRDASIFASYMDGCAMTIRPSVVFDDTDNGDPSDYQNYTSYFGSFFGGGNVGSMVMPGKVTFNFNKEVIIFSKLVGGCNNANVARGTYNAAYNGGVIGSAAEQDSYLDDSGNIKDRIVLNLNGVKLVPLRWKLQEATQQPSEGDDLTNLYLFTIDEEGVVKRATGNAVAGVTYYQQLNESGKVCLTPGDQPVLEYNVFDRDTDLPILALDASSLGTFRDADLLRRHKGANVYGACYNSGHVNGNVVINLNNTIHDCDKIFDEIDESDHLDAYTSYTITQRHTGVILNEQAMDVSIPSLAVFGAGYGEASEVWGSATINLNKGFTFQIYGGGERGIVGKASDLTYNGAYSTCSNLNGTIPGVAVGATGDSEDMADAVFVYGGSYEGLILGDTQVNLGNGRVYNAIAGSCTADIYGHSEMYIGRGTSDDDNHGFPWVADDVYGGNDVAGEIKGSADFTSRVREAARSLVYDTDVLTATSYVEYQQGRVSSIFGGSCGDFDYTGDPDYSIYADFVADKDVPLFVENTFVNFSPLVDNSSNRVAKVFGAGQGHVDGAFKDKMQERSYVLVDVPQGMTTFTTTEIFGAGSYGGVGMSVVKATADANESGVEASAVVDLVRGQVAAAYGGSYNQGVTRRTIVNVPSGSTSVLNNIFGGAYGTEDGTHSNKAPCDVYQSIVNYGSANARINGALYGGNNNYRRTLYTQVNLTVPLKQSNGYDGYIYGAGKGTHTWAQYTEVNLENGSSLYEVYGGGDAGKVLNEKSLTAWNGTLSAENMNTIQLNLTTDDATTGYTENYLTNSLARTSELYTDLNGRYKTCDKIKTYDEKYNTNVLIKQGALVKNYAYGGGYGTDAVVSGSTYIALLGGKVNKDMYAAGTSGAVKDLYGTTSNHFSASATAYVRGGSVRNVYGGGWEGDVGYHDKTTTATTTDIPGETHVVIGRKTCPDDSGLTFYDGKPVVQRNAYGGGEGGAVFGDAHITLFNGYIGYYYDSDTDAYLEDLNDETATDGVGENLLLEAGNIFGSGYADYSNADNTEVALYGGVVRNSIYGGGEIGTVGRGISNGTIYKGGSTNVMMFEGHVLRNAFGGGRGYDNLNRISSIGTSGYVFGSTKIHIHGGEVGTEEGVANGDGNVFGGGNIGFVYSALGTKQGTKGDGNKEGYYYDSSDLLTEDCSVVIAPWTKVTSAEGLTLNGTTYEQCNYVPAEALNFLKNKSSDSESWSKVDDAGVVVRNAVFAGGNVSTGSDQVYANTKTVFGNATATIYDIYNRDLITLGTEHVGGLYGDGNLTFVDGYRELNITNYGTDYYGMSDNITYDQYQNLSDRERAYFELNYKCTKSYTSTTLGEVSLNKKISEEEWNALPAEEKANWTLAGFCTIYAGRLMNTIQRADFCGIFGSRMVLQGALDRVPSEVDYKPYTINRVGELSLNKSQSLAVGDTDPVHGCYFGIYSLVNYLGALTTDVDFHSAKREWDTGLANPYVADSDSPGQTYAQWKERHLNERKRNNGVCDHKVALASGVYLEITKEESTKDNKVWGPITGVCQLDLIDVSTGLGGGYVYAKNIHGTRSASGNNQTILSTYNKAGHGHAAGVTNKIWTYAEATSSDEMETSGNFIHNYKQIVDDCYPVGHSYSGSGASAAHYWFIRGDIYIYDQYISAYTGSASAYAETIDLPLTITPASGGKLRLVNVQPNFYAYYDDAHQPIGTTDDAVIVNGVTYSINDPITYWDWSQLSAADKAHFVSETYITTAECTLDDGTVIPEGTVYLPSEYESLRADNFTVTAPTLDSNGAVPFDDVFHPTNNIGHSTGYALTFDMSNPKVWDRYYSPVTGSSQEGKKTSEEYSELNEEYKAQYHAAPTYTPKVGGVYGQHDYVVGDIIPDAIHDTYEAITSKPTENQATVVEAYVAKDEVIYIIDGTEHHAYKGTSISKTDYDQLTDEQQACFAAAHLCTSTIDLGNNEYVFYGDLLTDEEISTYKATYKTYLISQGYSDSDAQTKANTDFATDISDAWYCTVAGKYGGDYYEASKNYRALDAWCSMPESDRANFTFNYDALDLLIDENYEGDPKKYDGYDNTGGRLYSPQKAINYLATYNGEADLTYTDEEGGSHTIKPGSSIDNEAYEDLPNEKRHYKSITVDASGYYYIVKVAFTVGDVPYSVGTTLSSAVYGSLDADQKNNVEKVHLTKDGEGESNTYHYCREAYTINEKGEGVAVKDINDRTHLSGSEVSVGTIISDDEFVKLTNKQTNFTIHGTVPVETSTLYVAKESDINNLSEDKIITVIYEYTYEESDATGNNVDEITEQHIVNIHLQFRSGVPEIGELQKPNIVLPGTSVGLKQPNVTPGAYEIIGGGWEMYTNETDANNHTNGVPYENNVTKLYWYQDGYYVTYYAKSYLGKTYSNEVQFAVANYHDMDEVMQHKVHHMYVDYPVVKRPSKIYIDDRDCKSDETKSELDLLKDFYDLSLLTTEPTEGTLRGHKLLNNHITQCDNLDIILRSDVKPKAYTNWTPIGDDRKCFSGTLHGDGYTISGLNNSLFNYLCGNVYNLGVTGTFTGSGIAEHGSGYIENCWVSTSSTEARTNKPVLGDPMAARDVKQIVNCYYQEDDDATNKYENHTGTHGIPTRKPAEAFYNGEVAYDLNGFYLFKRYCDPNVTSGTEYKYFTVDADNTLSDVPKTGYYADKMREALGTTDPVYCSSGYNGILYVEDRFDDGDFIYAAGTIPEGENERYWSDEDVSTYYPIWPDDYIFFGQRLNYGHADDQEHQPLPSYVIRLDNRILTVKGNRVYRAPAYFQSSDMKSAHFNPDAYLAELSKDGTRTAYPNMTAIDFTGCNDVKYGYRLGLHSNSFFPPLLDDDGLSSIVNIDETKNLLFYIPQATSSDTDPETKTNLVVTDYLPDATYAETNTTYRTVAVSQRIINGHRVVKNNAGYAEGSYTAPVDHRLVDKQDFNAPIEYTFASGRRMWYQRTPDTFVDRTKGWDGISIPFSPEVVTTQTKGELTHFYTGSTTGHEYWLREYDSGGAVDSENENIFVANFRYPDAGTSTKTYTNTFLWDYYYSQNPKSEGKAGQDINTDEYQKKDNDRKYYSETRTYSDYAYAAAGKPYIIGLPGDTYYEFDLSGTFIPEHTYLSIDQLPTQTITFASKAAATIAISDTELKNGKVTADGYVFQPNYLATTLGSGESYMMESDGSAYKQTTAATASVPFRPYITPAPGGGVKGVTDIIFSSVSSSLDEEAERGNGDADSGKLLIRSKRGRILVKSNCSSTTVVHIVSAAGALIRTFDIAPGQSVETPVAAGVFLVNKKKIFVN